MKTKPPFIRSDGVIELHAVTPVDTDIPTIIFPAHPENDRSVRLGHPFKNLIFDILGALIDERNDTSGNFSNRLMKFFFSRVSFY